MKVFISWSGPRSKHIASALRSWLPDVIQSLDPWMSDTDIESGSRWLFDVTANLDEALIGILCVTEENQSNPWLIFEAGALSKSTDRALVCPLLFGITPTQMTGPLTQFQSKSFDEKGVLETVEMLNKNNKGGKLPDDRLAAAFKRCWPDLEQKLKEAPNPPDGPIARRNTNEMLDEILTLTREQSRQHDEVLGTVRQSVSLIREQREDGAPIRWKSLTDLRNKRTHSNAELLSNDEFLKQLKGSNRAEFDDAWVAVSALSVSDLESLIQKQKDALTANLPRPPQPGHSPTGSANKPLKATKTKKNENN